MYEGSSYSSFLPQKIQLSSSRGLCRYFTKLAFVFSSFNLLFNVLNENKLLYIKIYLLLCNYVTPSKKGGNLCPIFFTLFLRIIWFYVRELNIIWWDRMKWEKMEWDGERMELQFIGFYFDIIKCIIEAHNSLESRAWIS